jgi:hypothetical protein
MGQQQLLLIVLGVIIVGIAIVVGINLFNANAEESAIDTAVSEGVNLGAMAQQYFKKPEALGGGGNAWDEWELTVPGNLTSTSNTEWALGTPTGAGAFDITGTPKAGSGYNWEVTINISPNEISSSVDRNPTP